MKIFFLLLFITSSLYAQELTFSKEIALEADEFIGYDSYKHLYFIKDGALRKEGDLGKFVFQDFQLGPISTVDLINPLNLVVFYAEVNTVVFLDNRLNEKERISFNRLPSFINASAATNAGNNRLWIFNTDTQQLELFNYRTNRETIFSQPYAGRLISQTSNFNDCYILTEQNLVKVNVYGSLLSERDSNGLEKIVRHGKNALGLKKNKLYFISEETIKPIEFDFGENKIKDLQLTQDLLYIYDGKKVSVFTLTQPKQ